MMRTAKTFIHRALKKKILRARPSPDKTSNVPVHLNDVFNYVIDVGPRVTSFHEHITLFNLSALAKGDIIEIGSYICLSSVIMASAFGKSGRKLYAIDPFDRERGWKGGKSDSWIYERYSQLEFAKKVIADCGLESSIVIKPCGSNECVEEFRSHDIGLIFVDGRHSYEGVMEDLVNYAPFLRERGFLVLHDYNNESHAGVKRAVDEFIASRADFAPLYLVQSMLITQRY